MIADQRAPVLGERCNAELQPLLPGLDGKDRLQQLEHRPQIEGKTLGLDSPRFGPGKIERPIEQALQDLRDITHLPDQIGGRHRNVLPDQRLGQRLGQQQHRMDGRADLVVHEGLVALALLELALFGLTRDVAQFSLVPVLLRLDPCRGVDVDAGKTDRLASLIMERSAIGIQPARHTGWQDDAVAGHERLTLLDRAGDQLAGALHIIRMQRRAPTLHAGRQIDVDAKQGPDFRRPVQRIADQIPVPGGDAGGLPRDREQFIERDHRRCLRPVAGIEIEIRLHRRDDWDG